MPSIRQSLLTAFRHVWHSAAVAPFTRENGDAGSEGARKEGTALAPLAKLREPVDRVRLNPLVVGWLSQVGERLPLLTEALGLGNWVDLLSGPHQVGLPPQLGERLLPPAEPLGLRSWAGCFAKEGF